MNSTIILRQYLVLIIWVYLLLIVIFSVLHLQTMPQSLNAQHHSCSTNRRNYPCTPAVNIFFLKTHKCASSTVQNILMRYGDKRNLSFVLSDSNYIGHPEPFSSSKILFELVPKSGFNIFCHHTRFQHEEIKKIMPPDTIYVTILRDPKNLFVSLYSYYELHKYTKLSLTDFFNDKKAMEFLRNNRFNHKIGPNQMMFDLGFDNEFLENPKNIDKAIEHIENTFDLVIIAEKFDESLILLRNNLCWSTEDIVYFKQNQRNESDVTNTTKSLFNSIEKYNQGDQKLYNHFLQKLNEAIDLFGKDSIEEEVQELTLWNSVWFQHCVEAIHGDRLSIGEELRPSENNINSFELKKGPISKLCYKMATPELQYTEYLKEKQKRMINDC